MVAKHCPDSDLATIKTLYRNRTMELIGIPYPMRAGQSPRDLERAKAGWFGPVRFDLDDWVCLGWPGWWGNITPTRQVAIQQFLLLHDVPENPYEYVGVE